MGDRGRHQKGGRLTVGEGEQVEVTSRPERVREPSGVEHGALEDKEFPVRRDTEPKEKSLERISGEHTLEVGLLLSREVLQQRPYRSGDIPRLTRRRRPPFPDRVSDPKPPCVLRVRLSSHAGMSEALGSQYCALIRVYPFPTNGDRHARPAKAATVRRPVFSLSRQFPGGSGAPGRGRERVPRPLSGARVDR